MSMKNTIDTIFCILLLSHILLGNIEENHETRDSGQQPTVFRRCL